MDHILTDSTKYQIQVTLLLHHAAHRASLEMGIWGISILFSLNVCTPLHELFTCTYASKSVAQSPNAPSHSKHLMYRHTHVPAIDLQANTVSALCHTTLLQNF